MDFDLREWLLILGPIFIVGVLLHGYIRMLRGQNSIRMKLDKEYLSKSGEDAPESVDDLSLLKAELPNGGARVIAKPEQASLELDDEARAPQDNAEVLADENHENDETGDNEDVPVLMESVELPRISALDDEEPVVASVTMEEQEPEPTALPPEPENTVAADTAEEETPSHEEAPQPSATRKKVAKAPPARRQEDAAAADADKSSHAETIASGKPEMFVVIHVLAQGEHFAGQKLIETLLAADMSLGEMDIFHRMQEDGHSAFSLANAVEPGTFDMATIDSFSTPGVTLFMRAHEVAEPLHVFDEMMKVADSIALELVGEVRDESRSVMTPQTLEHSRQSIREFQYKYSA